MIGAATTMVLRKMGVCSRSPVGLIYFVWLRVCVDVCVCCLSCRHPYACVRVCVAVYLNALACTFDRVIFNRISYSILIDGFFDGTKRVPIILPFEYSTCSSTGICSKT